ncbi:MAG: hypothetical protein PHU12_02490 [Candidatus Aenigmarchaeota archaeon]|nr:hypothetical protein [Candidatus Aenigmarchaeota archaeon]
MTQVDFIMAIVITIGVISFSIYYVSNDFANNMNDISLIELRSSADVLENKILHDITEQAGLMKSRFEETSGDAHTETVNINMNKKIDYFVYEGDRLIASGSKNSIIITVSLAANQIRYFDIYYSGSTNVRSIMGNKDISVRILSEQPYEVASEDKCSKLNYNQIRDFVGHDFKLKIGTCEIGLNPPEETIVSRSFPVVLNYKSQLARLMIW